MTLGSYKSANLIQPEISAATLPEPVRKWNATRTIYPREKTVAQLFEETVATYADAVAVTFSGSHLTYQELNTRANRLAHQLRRMGVQEETMVGCCIERSLELIVAFIAILKAGGAYVPLDPSSPKERLELLLEDTRMPLMLTQKALASSVLPGRDLPSLFVDEGMTLPPSVDDANPSPVGGPTNLAYVMYTSGSTGRPKGVMVENRAIVRLVRNTNFCRFGPEQVFLQLAPVSFDASTFEIWGALLNGGRLVVMPPQASSLEEIGRTLQRQRVTTLWLTAGLFNLMVEERLEDLRPVQQLLTGGDVLSAPHVRKVIEKLPDCCLINGYGPTENTTFTCCHRIHPADPLPDSIPIGKPISNTQVYILDEQLQPLPAGIPGELYAAGEGVARGYMNDSKATAESFLPNPFVNEPEARMYRTGDVARWREDGIIEFLGRVDSQVKILGYRVEPGEVETVLRMHKGVKQVCVVPHADENGSKRLVAYYVPFPTTGASPLELRKFLARKVLPYMVPALFIPLESIPLSPNGKVDRAALPAPTASTVNDAPAEAPRSQLEQSLADLWRRVLRVDRVGVDDNFFDLGGDSLLLVAVHSNLQKMLQVEIPVTDLFEFTTIRKLSRHLDQKKPAGPSFSTAQEQARRQRDAFARVRERRSGGTT